MLGSKQELMYWMCCSYVGQYVLKGHRFVQGHVGIRVLRVYEVEVAGDGDVVDAPVCLCLQCDMEDINSRSIYANYTYRHPRRMSSKSSTKAVPTSSKQTSAQKTA